MFISVKVWESGHQSLASSIKYPGAQKSPRRHIIYWNLSELCILETSYLHHRKNIPHPELESKETIWNNNRAAQIIESLNDRIIEWCLRRQGCFTPWWEQAISLNLVHDCYAYKHKLWLSWSGLVFFSPGGFVERTLYFIKKEYK